MLYHPDAQKTFLSDRFGSPVDVGDKVVIAVKARPYSMLGPTLADAEILKITPLVEPPNGLGYWLSTGQKSRVPLVREDQLSRSRPTEYLMPGTEYGPPDYSKAYVVSVRVLDYDKSRRPSTIPYGWNLIRVPS